MTSRVSLRKISAKRLCDVCWVRAEREFTRFSDKAGDASRRRFMRRLTSSFAGRLSIKQWIIKVMCI